MLTFIGIGVLFVFWTFVFAVVFKDPYIGSICSVFATPLTLWVLSALGSEKKATAGH
jgi:hypothetical protein